MLKWSRQGLVLVFLALLVLAGGYGDFRPTNLDLTIAPYKYNLVRWEASHFLDKWGHKLADLLPWTSESSRQERFDQAKEFFELGRQLSQMDQDPVGAGGVDVQHLLSHDVGEWLVGGELEAFGGQRGH